MCINVVLMMGCFITKDFKICASLNRATQKQSCTCEGKSCQKQAKTMQWDMVRKSSWHLISHIIVSFIDQSLHFLYLYFPEKHANAKCSHVGNVHCFVLVSGCAKRRFRSFRSFPKPTPLQFF